MIRFIIDSTFGISKEYSELHNIKIVNLKLILDGEVTDEGFEGDWDKFYQALQASKSFPTTSQANPYVYEKAIQEIYDEDENAEIIILTVAGGLSGTINSAKSAVKKFEDKKIIAIDSENAAQCCRIMIEELVDFVASQKTFEEAIEYCEYLKTKLTFQFVPDTMDALKRGGRIGKLSSILASILHIKPVFEFKNNVISVPAKALGISKAIMTIIKRLPQKIKRLYICYIFDKKNVAATAEKLNSMLDLKNQPVLPTSPVFGIHVGVGTFGIACLES